MPAPLSAHDVRERRPHVTDHTEPTNDAARETTPPASESWLSRHWLNVAGGLTAVVIVGSLAWFYTNISQPGIALRGFVIAAALLAAIGAALRLYAHRPPNRDVDGVGKALNFTASGLAFAAVLMLLTIDLARLAS